MLDRYGRNIDYMRISITDRCNLRCRYCMPREGIEKVPMSRILTYEEILRVCRAAAGLGIRKFKVTGGEPLVRKGCAELCGQIRRIPGVDQVTLTTNGQLLAAEMGALREAGIDGINISLDSLREDRYEQITCGGRLADTLEGLEAAIASGIPVKINCLLQRDFNEDELDRFARLAFERSIDVRFIEIMPIGFGRPETGLSNEAVLQRLEHLYPDLVRDERIHGNGPAVYYRRSTEVKGTDGSTGGSTGSIGLISAMHSSFCGSCNRIRLTSTGEVKPCLCYEDSISLKPALEEGSNEALQWALADAINEKPAGHSFEDRSTVDRRAMMQIGG
ncbi:MAG: GTP 3',8-cyclase MoaA [Firmicutes bacterium]|nr:GTP 3',8-cyclase MoaA [Bacillota bacterium]